MIYGNTDHWPAETYPTHHLPPIGIKIGQNGEPDLVAEITTLLIAPEATGHDEAMRVRYRCQHSLSGAMDFSRVLLLEILFPDDV